MRTGKPIRLGDLQLRIMKVLWAHAAPRSVAQVQAELGSDALAYTTVATMLRKMEQRRLVSHEQRARRFLYSPRVTEDQVARSMANDLVNRIFEGSVTAAVSHLLDARDIDRRELVELERLIRARKRQDGT
jgi:BlaI family penicillinase repressor